eukprot:gene16510-16688_t
MSVREIRGWSPATALPHSPGYVRGVINLRGTVLPIIDLADRLGFTPTDPTARHVIIVVQVGRQSIGLLVDAVSDILMQAPDSIQATPEIASENVKTFVRGVLAIEGRMISLIALDSLTPQTLGEAAGTIRQTQSQNQSIVAGEFVMTSRDFQHIAEMLYTDAGIDLPESKAMLVYSRLAKRLRELQIKNFTEYCDFAAGRDGADERRKMLSALTTNVTSFFREKHHFEHLKDVALPSLLQAAQKGGRVRIWSAGCSTGQEPYSIALTILGMEPKAAQLDIRILATDIDPQVLNFGMRGIYEASALDSVPPELKRAHFSPVNTPEDQGFRVGEAPRKLVSFRELNLNGHWPMRGTFDAIFCRNVVIYFSAQTQQVIWQNMAGKMVPGSWLYIGHSERVSGPVTPDFNSSGITTYRYKTRTQS